MFPTIPGFGAIYATTDAGRPTTPPAPEPNYAHMGAATRDLVLRMCPSEWHACTKLSVEFPDHAGYRAVAVLGALIPGVLPDPIMRRVRKENISPVEAWTRMEEEYAAAERLGRGIVIDFPQRDAATAR